MDRIDYKVPNGKLLRIDAEIEGLQIKQIKIHGDFFMHPESGLESLEDACLGSDIGPDLFKNIEKICSGLSMIGVSSDDIISTLGKFIKTEDNKNSAHVI